MIKTIIFDLGGIFIQINTKQSIRKLCDQISSFSEKEVINMLIRSDHYSQYEKGFIDCHTFYERIKRELDGKFSFGFFKNVWQHIFAPIQPMIDLLPRFKLKYQLVLLSNTNALHMQYIEKQFPFFHHFDHIFYSFEIGLIKPDKAIYQYTLDQIQSDPGECVFIDDTDDNVRSAGELGIRSYRFLYPHYLQELYEGSTVLSIQNVLLDYQNDER